MGRRSLSDAKKNAVKKYGARISIILCIAAVAYLFNRYGLLQKTLDLISGCGIWAPWIFLGVYLLSCVFFVPSFIFTFSSGILFGFWQGFLLSVLGTGLGSLSAFLIGRYLARGWVEKRIEKNREFQRLALALEKKGWKVIMLARFSPLFPFSIGNYAFGVTRVRARDYGLASMLGTIPSALVYAYLGFVTGDFSGLQNGGRERTWGEWALLLLGLAATFFLAWYLRKIAESSMPPSGQSSSNFNEA